MALVAMHGAQAAFTDNGDGTVTDQKTGLTWMRCLLGMSWDGSTCLGSTASMYTFGQAIRLQKIFAGKSDWRLPNIRELQTIVDRSVYNPAIDKVAFPNAPSWALWSSSFDLDISGSSYVGSVPYVDFLAGMLDLTLRNPDKYNYKFAVRLVRGSMPFDDFYVANGEGTVAHTNLTWKRCAEGQTWTGSTCSGTASTYTLDQANALAGTTTFAGQIGWRVPTADELLSLLYGYGNPAIDTKIFPGTPGADFWSSSPYPGYRDYFWNIGFARGQSYPDDRNSKYAVRLVRTTSANTGKACLIYKAAFDRAPDAGGFKYWTDRLDTGASLEQVSAEFIDSYEFKTLYGFNPTNAEFLTKLYNNVLHRTPDQGGYDWWLYQLNAGHYTKETALASFAVSAENKANIVACY